MLVFLIAFFATTIGALSGLGGGVMIKPLLDLAGGYDAGTVNMLSSFTVLSMATTAVLGHIRMRTHFQYAVTVQLAIGAVAGGILGDWLLLFLIEKIRYPYRLTDLQNILLLCILFFSLLYMNFGKQRNPIYVKSVGAKMGLGLLLGMIATFVGIGGGPLNLMVLSLFFAMDTKEAAINSLMLILFSQGAKLLNSAVTVGFSAFHLTALLVMIPGGLLGGLLGAAWQKRMGERGVLRLFNGVVIVVILVSGVNIWV